MQQGPGVCLRDQALTTRGYALLQLNYIGSTGYGCKYRNSLKGQWEIGDIQDVKDGVDHLARQELIDPTRVAITGHSAGGYATLQALSMFPDLWACGVDRQVVTSLVSPKVCHLCPRIYSYRHINNYSYYHLFIPFNVQ